MAFNPKTVALSFIFNDDSLYDGDDLNEKGLEMLNKMLEFANATYVGNN